MSKRVNIIFEGLIKDLPAVQEFQKLLTELGAKTILVVDKLEEADMKVDISEITAVTDLVGEAIFTIKTAKGIQKYERKRKRMYKETGRKILMATSRKEIN